METVISTLKTVYRKNLLQKCNKSDIQANSKRINNKAKIEDQATRTIRCNAIHQDERIRAVIG